MAANNICKLNKFSHCRFGRFCNFIHEECFDKNCDAKHCSLCHPKPCRYILQKKVCKFGELCSFEHSLDTSFQATSVSSSLQEKVKEMENLIKAKDQQIDQLKLQLSQFERENIFNLKDSDLDSDSMCTNIDEEELSSENESNLFHCENCYFKTEHKRGLKVHYSRKHKFACETCDRRFERSDDLHKHAKVEEFFENICEKKSEEFGLELKMHSSDEPCFAIFAEKLPRDDSLPAIYLHCDECWNQPGQSCKDLPDPENQIDDERNEVILNHNTYNPTLHALLEWVLMGDIKMKGCYLDWVKVHEMIAKNMDDISA